mgnify:CR=1 FL=1|jgi:dolichol-phosphate mannosyltransferase
MKNTLIFIPVINELENLKLLFKKIFLFYPNISVLIIDDNSDDGTEEWIKSLNKKKLNYIKRNSRLGIGYAHYTAILWAYKNKFNKIITMDGDLSHNPLIIKKFIKKSKLKTELIFSNRYNKKINHYKNWPILKKIINKLGRLIIIILFDVKYDITSGFRLYNLEQIPIDNFKKLRKFSNYEFFIVSGIRFVRKFKTSQIFIDMPYRVSGNSKMKLKHLIIWFITIFKLKFLS